MQEEVVDKKTIARDFCTTKHQVVLPRADSTVSLVDVLTLAR
jgi:hypothetical protein